MLITFYFRLFTSCYLFLSLFQQLTCQQVNETLHERPNVLLIIADDMGWGDLSLNGNAHLSTPHIDSIGTQGASFLNFMFNRFAPPTRAEILTGNYFTRSGVTSTSAGGERIALSQTLMAEYFTNAGYRTGYFGKWHSGTQHPYHPMSRGFDEFYGFTSGHWGQYFEPPLDQNGQRVKGEGYLPNDITNQAIDFLQKVSDPFLAILAFNTPHSPMQVPDQWWAKFEHSLQQASDEKTSINHTRAAYAMIENMDWNIGRLLSFLRKNDLLSNTIILFMSDNGPNGYRWNDQLKGIKGSTDEGGVKSPLLVYWQDHIENGKMVTGNAGSIDILPTLLNLCSVPVLGNAKFDGVDLSNVLLENGMIDPKRYLVHHWNNRTSIKQGNFRLDTDNGLYNLTSDPSQKFNLSEDKNQFEIYNRMMRFKNSWQVKMSIQQGIIGPEHFTIGHTNQYKDFLPARDGHCTGNIKRSNKYPNDSFFTNWTSSNDTVYWNIDVLTAGYYQFELFYTCAPESIGTTLSLSNNGTTVSKDITRAHNPPLKGKFQDRVPRIESYTKDFTSMQLGQLFLDKGKSRLNLLIPNLPGSTGVDIKGLDCKLVSYQD